MHEREYRRYSFRHMESDYSIDQSGVLCYWDPVTKRTRHMLPAQPIDDDFMMLGKIGQQNLLPSHLTIKPKDAELTYVTDESGNMLGSVPPGISAYLFWGTHSCGQENVRSFTQSHLFRPATDKNRLYVADAGTIKRAGWIPFFAPLIKKDCSTYSPLHVILCPQTVLAGQGLDATEVEKINLSEQFIFYAR